MWLVSTQVLSKFESKDFEAFSSYSEAAEAYYDNKKYLKEEWGEDNFIVYLSEVKSS